MSKECMATLQVLTEVYIGDVEALQTVHHCCSENGQEAQALMRWLSAMAAVAVRCLSELQAGQVCYYQSSPAGTADPAL